MNKKISFPLAVIIIVALAAIVATGAIIFCPSWQKTVEQPVLTAAPDATAGWKTYSNENYRYLIKYPSIAGVKEEQKDFLNEPMWLGSCIQITYKYGYVYISSGYPGPCGFPTGFGLGNSRVEEPIVIDGKQYTAAGHKYSYEEFCAQSKNAGLPCKGDEPGRDDIDEVLLVNLDNDNYIVYGLRSDKKITNEEYQETKNTIIKIVQSYKKQSQIISPTTTPSPETANWRTYRNEEYGFEIKYPDNIIFDRIFKYNPSGGAHGYYIDPTYGEISHIYFDFVGNKDEAYFDITINNTIEVKEYGSIDEYVNRLYDAYNRNASVLTIKSIKENKIKIDGYQAIELYMIRGENGLDDVTTYLRKDSSIWKFYIAASQKIDTKDIETYRKMLSTFKFIK